MTHTKNGGRKFKGKIMARLRGNLHTHTIASDGKNTVEEMIAKAKQVGYGFLAITDHDQFTPIPPHEDIIVMQGCEWSSFNGIPEHLLEIRGEAEVLKIKAHPNRYGDTCSEIRSHYEADKYDCIESTEHAMKHPEYYRCGVPHIWTDDAHRILMLGKAWITVEVTGTTADDIIRAIKAGNYWLGNPPPTAQELTIIGGIILVFAVVWIIIYVVYRRGKRRIGA